MCYIIYTRDFYAIKRLRISVPYLSVEREFSLSRCIAREFISSGYRPVKGPSRAEFPARS